MKLWRLVVMDPTHGQIWTWFSSRAQAEAEAREWRDHKRASGDEPDSIEIERVDFPMRRKALLRWLNNWAGANNG